MAQYWLFKTEPGTYSFETLLKDKKINWNGVRNFQARNFLKQTKAGDMAIIYHSGEERAAVGLVKIVRAAYPDPDPKKPGDWVQIDLAVDKKFHNPVTLASMKANKALAGLLLIKQSRLSCMPVEKKHYDLILAAAKME